MNEVGMKVLQDFYKQADALKINFMLIGAYALECFCEKAGITPHRKTLDVDVACYVESWAENSNIVDDLIATGLFTQDKKVSHRLRCSSGVGILDILPFGEIEDQFGNIKLATRI